jgi:hypothetical protein
MALYFGYYFVRLATWPLTPAALAGPESALDSRQTTNEGQA